MGKPRKFNHYDVILGKLNREFKNQPGIYSRIEKILNDSLQVPDDKPQLFKNIYLLKFYVCKIFDISPQQLKSGPSTRNFTLIRQIFYFHAKQYFGERYTLFQFSEFCSDKPDHNNAITAIKKFTDLIKVKDDLAIKYLRKWEDHIKFYENKV